MKMGAIRRTASSVTSYQTTPRGIEERKFQPRRVRSQKSHRVTLKLWNLINNKLLQADLLYSVIFIAPIAQQPPVGQGLLIIEASRSHFFRYNARQDCPGRVISPMQKPLPDNTQHLQETCQRRDSDPQPQQASGRRPTPYTARPLVMLLANLFLHTFENFDRGVWGFKEGVCQGRRKDTVQRKIPRLWWQAEFRNLEKLKFPYCSSGVELPFLFWLFFSFKLCTKQKRPDRWRML